MDSVVESEPVPEEGEAVGEFLDFPITSAVADDFLSGARPNLCSCLKTSSLAGCCYSERTRKVFIDILFG
jgi:hypothetical protein